MELKEIENLENLKSTAIKKITDKLENFERITKLMKPSIDILRKRDGEQFIKVECAINNIIEYYDKLNREV